MLHTTLLNANPVIHPAITLLNAARIEQTGGAFMYYEEGATPAAGRLLRAVDNERIQLGAALGVRLLPDPELGCHQGYMTEPDYETGYARAPGFRGIRAPSSLDTRYFHEDVGYGLVFLQSLGRRLGVPTPAADSLIRLISILMDRDYAGAAPRTVESLGLVGRTAAELRDEIA